MANSARSDQTVPKEQSDLGLHFLHKAAWLQQVAYVYSASKTRVSRKHLPKSFITKTITHTLTTIHCRIVSSKILCKEVCVCHHGIIKKVSITKVLIGNMYLPSAANKLLFPSERKEIYTKGCHQAAELTWTFARPSWHLNISIWL